MLIELMILIIAFYSEYLRTSISSTPSITGYLWTSTTTAIMTMSKQIDRLEATKCANPPISSLS